jgi:hypothetical protein
MGFGGIREVVVKTVVALYVLGLRGEGRPVRAGFEG